MCCDWLRKLFKETEIKPVKIPGRTVTVKITEKGNETIDILESDYHPVRKLTRLKYTDTGEIVELDLNDRAVFDEIMTNMRPVEILGFVH